MKPGFRLLVLAALIAAPTEVAAQTPLQAVTVDIQHQAVLIDPFAEDVGLSGEQAMTFRAVSGGDRLRFTGGPLQIVAASLDGRPVETWETADGAIELRLKRTLDADSDHALHLSYRAPAGRGFVRSDDLAYSTYFACDWMLCSQGDFSDRFTTELTVRTPRGMRTLGPGTEAKPTPDGDGERHHWRTTEPYPAYIHGFVAGRLDRQSVTNDCAVRLDVLSTAPAERVQVLFGETCAMLRYFEERSGVVYPADRYSQLYVPERDEAQEAISHSTLGGASVEAMLTDPAEDWALAHELAHQWWGNRITAADLSQFWLNEGIVTFMVASWKERRWGPQAYEREIGRARDRWTRCRDAGNDAPLAFAGPYASLGARRCIQYSKGAVFLHELRGVMGDDAFWRGLRAFTAAGMGRPVTSRDFEAAMQAATGENLRPLFAAWVDPVAA